MAKRVVAEYFSFNPATRTVTIPNRIIPRKQLMLITNVNLNTVIYNFSDPDLQISNYVCPFSSTGTQFTLTYNTSSMNSSDSLLILEDIPADPIDFAETVQDATNKLRVANPTSLIDTDFEYGLQPIKWESVTLVQNIPSFYFRGGGNSLAVASISGDNVSPRSTITVTTTTPHGLVTSDIVSVSYASNFLANGAFNVSSVANTTTLTFSAKGQVNGSVFTSSVNIQGGDLFDSNNNVTRIVHGVITSDNAAASPGSMITINTIGKHALIRGTPILVNSSTTATINGNWTVYDTPTPSSFRFRTDGTQTGTGSPNSSTAVVVVRPEATYVHRAYDGGVLITTSNIQEGISAIRQTRRYFRYQSGKGIQMSSGTKFSPTFDLQTINAVGTSVVAITQQPCNLASGVTLLVEGVEVNSNSTNPYNGTFTAKQVYISSNTIVFDMPTAPSDTAPGGTTPQITVSNWRGSAIRVGMYDAQNGFYFEYDGTTVFCVRRTSVRELLGTVAIADSATTVTGTNTRFTKQIVVGDYVVIRGQSYLVAAVDSDTSLEIAPHYRGTPVSGVRMNITQNLKIPQVDWNLDKCDGNGTSGYVLNMAKMQMCYIDYTWYGAGYIRFGFRMTNGNIVYCHKIVNNNVNTAAYMRSGNLPARYEVSNVGPTSRFISASNTSLGVTLGASDTSLMVVKDAQYWPNYGEIMVQQGNLVEIMSFSSKTQLVSLGGWQLNNLSRRQFGATTSNVNFSALTFDSGTSTAQCAVSYITTDCAPIVSHWGTSVIMDGGYDEDKSIVFSYGKRTETQVLGNTSVCLMAIRLAPSVDNSITGALGEREIVNRMQLKLNAIGLNTQFPGMLIQGVLNPRSFVGNSTFALGMPTAFSITSLVSVVGSNSLAQVYEPRTGTGSGGTTAGQGLIGVTGGEQIFSFITGNGADTYNLGDVRDLGNSLLGGDGSNLTPGFPNGPDILAIVATNTSSTAIRIPAIRISWTEAQA